MSEKPGFINSVSLKIIVIGFLVLALLVPKSMISSLISERSARKSEVIRELSDKWGGDQTVSGPVLTIPYKKAYENKDGELRYTVEIMNFLPEKLAIKGKIIPEVRYRSIYKAVLYNADIEISGAFPKPDFADSGIEPKNIIWSGAAVSLGISDMKGIKESIEAKIGNAEKVMNPGVISTKIINSGVGSRLNLDGSETLIPFSFKLNLNGSQNLDFMPLGKITTVALESSWANPSFTGAFLPEKRTITDNGFSAEWKVFHLNRNYPQKWSGELHKICGSAFGLDLIITADVYQKSERTIKYGLMFIVMTFSVFFFAEILMNRRVHPVQYLMIGFALTMFYVLLTALAEHIGFDISYFISAIAIVALITGYSKAIMGGKAFTLSVFSALSLLYAYLYVILQLEDYALIMGSLGLFAVLGLSMYLTRNIDWYSLNFGKNLKEQE